MANTKNSQKWAYMQLWPNDFLADTAILSLASCGFWIRALLHLHKRRHWDIGTFSGPLDQWAQIGSCTPDKALECLEELQHYNVADVEVSRDCHGNVTATVTNRRIVREEGKKAQDRERQQRKRAKVKDDVTLMSRDCHAESHGQCHADVTDIVRESESQRDKDIKTDTEHSLSIQARAFIDCWNAMADRTNGQVSKIRNLNSKRKRTLSARLKDPKWVEGWQEAVNAIPDQPQLMGKVPGLYWEGKTVTVDWFLQPEKVDKILEGQYGQTEQRANGNGPTTNRSFELAGDGSKFDKFERDAD